MKIDKIVEEAVQALNKEQERGSSSHQSLKLPCGCGYQEITEPRDQKVQCGKCHKTFYLVWQAQPKIQSEAK